MQARISKFYCQTIALILLTLSVSADLEAKRPRNSRNNNFHFWSVGVSGGYSTLIEDYTNLNTTGSYGFTGHFGYEYENQGFWFSPVLELQYFQAKATSAVTITDRSIRDNQTPQKDARMHYELTSGLNETQRFLFLNVPLMAGYYSPEGFYFGAGLRLGYYLPVRSDASISYTTSATYSQYFDDFEDMPNHNYTDYKAKNDTIDLMNRFKVSFIGEIGYDLMSPLHKKGRGKYSALKVGAFVEYGLNNIINVEGSGSVCEINPYNASELVPRSYYSAYHTNKHRVVPLIVGIRVTFLFYVTGQCASCPRNSRKFY